MALVIQYIHLQDKNFTCHYFYVFFSKSKKRDYVFCFVAYVFSNQWRNYGRQWRQPPQGASPEGAPRDQCPKFFLTPHRLTMQSRRHDQ